MKIALSIIFLMFSMEVSANAPKSQGLDYSTLYEKVKQISIDYKKYRDACTDSELILRWRSQYFPTGGVRTLYCNLKSEISMKYIQEVVGEHMFTNVANHETPNLYSTDQFGHYNKKFLDKIYLIVDDLESSKAYTSLQPFYDMYFRDLFRIYYTAYKSLNINPEFRKTAFNEYKKSILDKEGIDIYKFVECPNIHAYWPTETKIEWGMKYYVSSTAIYFWLRRSIDGTEVIIFDILKKTIGLFDADFMSSVEQVVVDEDLKGEECYRPVYD